MHNAYSRRQFVQLSAIAMCGAAAGCLSIPDSTAVEPVIDIHQHTNYGGPRDPKGQIGAFEAALMNTPLAKADQPLEILRTLHSFDPCLACSTHVMSPDGEELSKVTVR